MLNLATKPSAGANFSHVRFFPSKNKPNCKHTQAAPTIAAAKAFGNWRWRWGEDISTVAYWRSIPEVPAASNMEGAGLYWLMWYTWKVEKINSERCSGRLTLATTFFPVPPRRRGLTPEINLNTKPATQLKDLCEAAEQRQHCGSSTT